jgi:hypothetical protein
MHPRQWAMGYVEGAYRSVGRGSNLLGQAHQQHLRSRGGPVVGEVVFSLRSNAVVRGLQSLQELGELCMDFGRQHRHVGWCCRDVVPGRLGCEILKVELDGSAWNWALRGEGHTGKSPRSICRGLAIGRRCCDEESKKGFECGSFSFQSAREKKSWREDCVVGAFCSMLSCLGVGQHGNLNTGKTVTWAGRGPAAGVWHSLFSIKGRGFPTEKKVTFSQEWSTPKLHSRQHCTTTKITRWACSGTSVSYRAE